MKIPKVINLEILKSLLLLRKFNKNAYTDISILKAKQIKNLKKILVHAYNTTNYYHTLFEQCGFNPYNIQNINDLSKLPVLEKDDIQKKKEEFLSKAFNKQELIVHHTSGSTGSPLSFYTNRKANLYNRALTYRAYMENGVNYRDVLVQITSPENRDSSKLWFQKLGFLRRHKLSILDEYTQLLEQMNVIKPNVVQCYPSMLNLLSQEFKKNHLKFKLKLIFTTAELLLPTWRKNISDFFDCDVIDLYGTSEFHRLAWECEKHEGYHLDIDAHVIEFLDNNNKPVEQGEGNIIITSLFNYAFPFIRYRIGDIAKLRKSKCTCDRSLPVINSIQGRDDDYIKLPSGKTVSPRKINVLDKLKGVKEYNIIQYKEDFIRVKIVKNDDFTENTIESIKTQILKGCQEDNIKIEIELVKEIERNSGKIRTVTSLIKKMIS